MPAAGDEQPAFLGRKNRRSEIDSGDRPARALAAAVLAFGDDDRRAAEALFDPAGDDADNALVPAAAHDRDDGVVAAPFGLLFGLLAHQHFDRSPLLVEAVELHGDGAGFLRV